eukprot:CAMPEP_0204822456 /NCGR_PEP_ID=MMETSP1346-20131115/637_1 /ASSEMBLY_ACC=CAM_ASM_000771 /TAXON_ID=215587 /ORGANISM="Aplanochytrium stocchinoi, Strain GSBS06" /LENGTH=592 /DNA_ID=CAMNT_0051948663 /DNA_START=309 /DNA_END=2087 /DNA_ORIENTATION=-
MRHAASTSNLPEFEYYGNGHSHSTSGLNITQPQPVPMANYTRVQLHNNEMNNFSIGSLDSALASISLNEHNPNLSPNHVNASITIGDRMQQLRQPQNQQHLNMSFMGDTITTSASSTNVAGESQSQNNNTGKQLYKTELCRKWMTTGSCRYGNKCQFAHGHEEVRGLVRHPLYKTSMCKSFNATGICRYGSRCRFIHDEPEHLLQSLPRVGSLNMLNNSATANGNGNGNVNVNINRGRVGQIVVQEEMGMNFPRVPSAPANLNINTGQAQLTAAASATWTHGGVGSKDYENVHGRQLSRNYPHQINLQQANMLQSQQQHYNVKPTSASVNDLTSMHEGMRYVNVNRNNNMGHSQVFASLSQAQELLPEEISLGFPAHLIDARDIPVAKQSSSNTLLSSANSSYSSTASSGNVSTSNGFSSVHSSSSFGLGLDDYTQETEISLFKSRSHPVLYDQVGNRLQQAYQHQLVEAAAHSFLKAPGSPPVERTPMQQQYVDTSPSVSFNSASGTGEFAPLQRDIDYTNTNPPPPPGMNSFARPMVRQQTQTQTQIRSFPSQSSEGETEGKEKETAGSRLDFFRSISGVDLQNLGNVVS